MAKKRIKVKLPANAASLERRIVVLAKLIWSDNKSRMAQALGISLSVLSRVLRGLQEPPGKLLEALAKWPGVNVRWLFAGEGEPLSERNLGNGGGRFLPIAKTLLPGPPADHPELLTWTSLPIADAMQSETAYWFAVPPDHPIIKDKQAKVKPGDYLLIETSPQWTRTLNAIRGRLCALQVQRPEGVAVVLGEIDALTEIGEFFFSINTFGQLDHARFLPPEIGPVEDDIRDRGLDCLRFQDIVGVCIKIDRIL